MALIRTFKLQVVLKKLSVTSTRGQTAVVNFSPCLTWFPQKSQLVLSFIEVCEEKESSRKEETGKVSGQDNSSPFPTTFLYLLLSVFEGTS